MSRAKFANQRHRSDGFCRFGHGQNYQIMPKAPLAVGHDRCGRRALLRAAAQRPRNCRGPAHILDHALRVLALARVAVCLAVLRSNNRVLASKQHEKLIEHVTQVTHA